MVKKIFLLLIISKGIFFANSQNFCDSITLIFGGPEEFPIFSKENPNETELLKFIANNTIYPASALKNQIEGKVVVEFWIDNDGITKDHRIIKSISEDLDEEAIRVARLLKFDSPAKNRGQPIITCSRITVSFVMSEKEKKLKNRKFKNM